jgi:HTH-type transcriptional regulator/antitoxin HigA
VLSEDWLNKLVKLSVKPNGPMLAVEHLAKAGIRLVIVPHLANTYLDGAAVMLKDGPVIGLTLRYDRIDSFWFVLLHELIHVKEHLVKDRTEIIFDDLDNVSSDLEVKTDAAAAEALIPKSKWDFSLPRYIRTKESIEMFSAECGISTAIIAGRIRREAKDYTMFTDMVGQGEVRKLFPQVDFSY